MPCRLSEEEIVTIRVLAEKGQNHCEIARQLGVAEGTVPRTKSPHRDASQKPGVA